MKNKTVIFILSLAVLLFLYIVVVERKLQTTDEQLARAENVFQSLRPELVNRIELKTKHGKIILAANDADPGEEQIWQIVSPAKYSADQTEVTALISAMDYLIYERVVKENQHEQQFGLTKPRIQGVIGFGDQQISFAVGNNATGDEGVYVATDDQPDQFFVVPADFLDAVNKNVNDLRDKHFVPNELTDVVQIAVTHKNGAFTARRNETDEWYLELNNTRVMAASSQLKQLLEQASALEVQQFVTDKTTDLKKYGIATPAITLTLITASKNKISVQLGAPCGKDAVYAHLKGSQAVHCVATHFAEILQRPTERYVEKRLLPFSEGDIARMEVEQMAEKLVLEKNEDDIWSVSGLIDEDTSLTAVTMLLEQLNRISATQIQFNASTDESSPLPSSPVATVFAETKDQRALTLHFYEAPNDSTQVFMQRNEADVRLMFPRDILTKLSPYPLRFRKKEWKNTHRDDILAVDIQSTGGNQTLQKEDGVWMISKPAAVKTDAGNIKKLLTLISETPVSEYVRTDDNPFAPAKMFAEISANAQEHHSEDGKDDVTATRTIGIEIGDKYDGSSRFARISGHLDEIFTIDDEFTAFLDAPLAARDLLQINSAIINKVEVNSPTLSFTATQTDGRWHSDQCALDSDALQRIIIDFGATKAVSAQQFGTQVGKTVTTVLFSSDESDVPAVLRFGDAVPQVDGVLAHRDGVPLTFALPMRLLTELTASCR